MHNTSVKADSSTSTVDGFSPSRSEFTIGITTADDVPPSVTPSSNDASNDRSNIRWPMPPTMATVITKVLKVSTPVDPTDAVSVLRSSEVPPSNKMTTSAMVAMMGPILPKSSAVTTPVRGPNTMPKTTSTNTSGTLVCLN